MRTQEEITKLVAEVPTDDGIPFSSSLAYAGPIGLLLSEMGERIEKLEAVNRELLADLRDKPKTTADWWVWIPQS